MYTIGSLGFIKSNQENDMVSVPDITRYLDLLNRYLFDTYKILSINL